MSRLNRKVLFVCTGNTCRSQMAEGLYKDFARGKSEAVSAGVAPESKVNPYAVHVMSEIGLDISRQSPKHITSFSSADNISDVIVLSKNAETIASKLCSDLKVENHTFWPVDDPAMAVGDDAMILSVYQRVRDELRERILKLLHQWSNT